MRAPKSVALITAVVVLLAACAPTAPLRGSWTVDIDETVKRATDKGIPSSAAPEIREIYDGGQLEIGGDTILLRIAGFSEAEAHNYKVVGEAGGCYKLEITRSQGIHSYCIDGNALVVNDPNAKLAVVYRHD